MRIAQVLPNLAIHDAIGNNVMLWRDCLTALGHENTVIATSSDPDFSGFVLRRPELARWKPTHIVYHFSTYDPLLDDIRIAGEAVRIMIYHNITPEEYFTGFSKIHADYSTQARKQLRQLPGVFASAVADSEFNAQELREMGYARVPVLPLAVPVPMDVHDTKAVRGRWEADGTLTILFVGRIAPNKRVNDLLMAYHYLKAYVSRNCRLILLGSWGNFEEYKKVLDAMVEELQLSDVYFLGETTDHVRDRWYALADVFVMPSEHEGFCVPIVEAWMADLPVIAARSSALPETIGNAGVLYPVGRPAMLAEAIAAVWQEPGLAEVLVERGRLRSKEYQATRFLRRVSELLKGMSNDI